MNFWREYQHVSLKKENKFMSSAICTLYEGHYHHGVAALTNSLYNNGFRGCVYVGYRGDLPSWAIAAKDNPLLHWEGGRSLNVAEGVDLHFLPVSPNSHLTNYKPDFMLQLWDGPAKNIDKMFYFDPDIVIKCNWNFFENWVENGVALVHEITANDMTINNPIRGMWAKIINENEGRVINSLTSYSNAGFFGLNKRHITFIQNFSKFIFLAKEKYDVDLNVFHFTNRADPFFAKDQDVMNIAAMCSAVPLSEMGPEAMDFIHGGFTMSHAIGGPKPWKKKFILSALKGSPPSLAEKAFWKNVGLPIKTFSTRTKKNKSLSIKAASFIGRFYRKY